MIVTWDKDIYLCKLSKWNVYIYDKINIHSNDKSYKYSNHSAYFRY